MNPSKSVSRLRKKEQKKDNITLLLVRFLLQQIPFPPNITLPRFFLRAAIFPSTQSESCDFFFITSQSQMERRSIADELYSEILETKTDVGRSQTSLPLIKPSHSLEVEDEQWCEDESSWDGSDEKLDPSSDLDREWQKRKNQFHAIGYRDGLIAGKEASAQEGFNIGFKESVLDGFNWGVIRGVTGALDCLPGEVKDKLIESKETRSKFHDLYESINNLSTTDALKVFHDGVVKQNGDVLDSYSEQLQALIVESPEIAVQLRNKSNDVSSSNLNPLIQ